MKKQLHTADHILCTVLEEYGATTKSMEFKSNTARITFASKKDLRQLKDELQRKVNKVVKDGLEVVNYKLDRKEAEKFTDVTMVPTGITEVSIYEIKEFNKVACGGPHVKNTKEVQSFNIIAIKKKGKDTYSLKYSVGGTNKKEDNELSKREKSSEKNKMKPQTAKGVRDVPPEEKILKNKVINDLKEVFELYGFVPLETPILERFETLAAKFAAGETSDAMKETFQLQDQGKRKLALRFDLTVPMCRFIAMNPTLKMPFKRYQFGPVFRDGPIKLGRYREFWQMDVDTAGTKSMLAEAEVLAIVQTAFDRWELDIVIKVNNRKILNGILEQMGVEKKEDAIIAIDKLDKIGEDGVREELGERGFTDKQADGIFSFIKEGTKLSDLKKKLKNEEGKEGVAELEELFSYLKSMNVKSAVFDVSLARGLGYYTGPAFEVFLKKGKITSSLVGGGRYDKMIGGYLGGGKEVPATGLSFGLAPIMDTLRLEKKLGARTVAKVYVIPLGTVEESLKVIQELRNSGVPADFALGKKGVSKNLQYANALGIPYAIIIGEDELKKNKVMLRNMETGDEQLLSVEDVIKKLAE